MNEQWKQLKETIIETRNYNKFDNKGVSSICQFLANYMNILEERMSNSESLNKWIPVSERLPKIDGKMLVTNGRGLYFGWFDSIDKGWRTDSKSEYFFADIVAWMPLPELYKTESEE